MEPPAKRARLDTNGTSNTSLFAPFRALGHVSNEVPFALSVHSAVGLQRPEFNIVSCLGRSWAMWGGKDMRVRFVGPEAKEPITSLTVNKNDVFAATGQQVLRYQRGRIAQNYSTAPNDGQVGELLIFGTQMVALETTGDRMWIWDVVEGALHTTVQFPPDFHATRIVHPATYLNKVLVASREGSLQLWNTVTSTLIHTFAFSTLSPRPSPVTALSQSPAVDVIAVGFENGTVVAFDIRLGEQLFTVNTAVCAPSTSKMTSATEKAVTAISFRTDNEAHTLATANADGTMAIWDLDPVDDALLSDDEEAKQPGRLLHLVRNAHEGRIGGLAWLPGQALLISSGADNSIKQWAFDSPTAEPRLLKSRSGHTAPPSIIRYYGDDGKALLSAGSGGTGKPGVADDRSLRYTSVVRDSRSFELSQGSIAKRAKQLKLATATLRAPRITDISYSNARSRDWDDVVTCHAGEKVGRSWSVENKRKGQWSFADAENDSTGAIAKCSCVSACGNFGLVGFSSGVVGLWNMQSGIRRRTFDARATMNGRRAAAATGIVADALNRRVVVGTQDGRLHWFDFHTAKHEGSLDLAAGISSLLLHRDNNLLAATCDDMVVRIVDIETRRIVRELSAFRGRIVDIAFSPDSRWLIVASTDAVIRTFDLPTGRLIDAFRTPSCATSLSFSPTGDFLATSHVDSVGVFLWANRAQFAEVSFRTVQQEDAAPPLSLPGFQGEEEHAPELAEYAVPTDYPDDLDLPVASAEQIASSLVTLSVQPRSKWQTLLNLDTIRARNKPKEPPKAPERAPFFLPTLPGVGSDTRFDLTAANDGDGKGKKRAEGSRLTMSTALVRSETVDLLLREDDEGEYSRFFAHLFQLSASALDLELRTLTPPDLAPILRALTARLKSHRDYEAVQAVLAVLLRVQGDVLIGLDASADEEEDVEAGREEALVAMEALLEAQQAEAKRLGGLVGFALGAIGFVRNAPSMA